MMAIESGIAFQAATGIEVPAAGQVLVEGPRLRLRRAALTDIDFIMRITQAPENVPYIFPFDRDTHTAIIKGTTIRLQELVEAAAAASIPVATVGAFAAIVAESYGAIDIISEEKSTGAPVGYFLVRGLMNELRELEWTHVVVDKKGCGYGHEGLKLLKKWSFDVMGFHHGWLDCKEYNARALHLYESEGLQRQGRERDTLRLADGTYETLVVLDMLEDEYRQRQSAGLELG